jgi:hypothetical protein
MLVGDSPIAPVVSSEGRTGAWNVQATCAFREFASMRSAILFGAEGITSQAR